MKIEIKKRKKNKIIVHILAYVDFFLYLCSRKGNRGVRINRTTESALAKEGYKLYPPLKKEEDKRSNNN